MKHQPSRTSFKTKRPSGATVASVRRHSSSPPALGPIRGDSDHWMAAGAHDHARLEQSLGDSAGDRGKWREPRQSWPGSFAGRKIDDPGCSVTDARSPHANLLRPRRPGEEEQRPDRQSWRALGRSFPRSRVIKRQEFDVAIGDGRAVRPVRMSISTATSARPLLNFGRQMPCEKPARQQRAGCERAGNEVAVSKCHLREMFPAAAILLTPRRIS